MKFKVWDKDKKIMHQGDKICRIHLDDGIPYAVLLWDGETLFHFVLHLGNYSWDSAKKKKTNKKGGENHAPK